MRNPRLSQSPDSGPCPRRKTPISRAYRRWQPWEDDFLRSRYANTLACVIAAGLDRTVRQVYARARALALRKSEEFLGSALSGRMTRGSALGRGSRFKPGQPAWNKGKSGLTGTQEACRRTQFKHGSKPHNWVPVGSHRITSQGVLEVKYSECRGSPSQRWKPVARAVWESAHGAVPEGMCIAFKPGRASTRLEEITLDALECVDRGELLRRNGIHAMAAELVEIVRLRATLTRVCNDVSKRARPQVNQQEEALQA